MKKFLILFSIITSVMITGCAKPQIVRIFPQEELSRIAIEEIINDKELTSEEKATLVQMKMAEDIERKKRAVEMEKDNKLSNIINRPVIPLRTPDTILRVLILPYEDDNGVLNGWKYSYVKVDDGKWVMADYLNGSIPSSKMTLTPLKTESNSKNIGSTGMAPPINNENIKTYSQYSEELKQEKKNTKKASKKTVDTREQYPKEADKEQAAVETKLYEKQSEKDKIKTEPALNEITVIDKGDNNIEKDSVNISSAANKDTEVKTEKISKKTDIIVMDDNKTEQQETTQEADIITSKQNNQQDTKNENIKNTQIDNISNSEKAVQQQETANDKVSEIEQNNKNSDVINKVDQDTDNERIDENKKDSFLGTDTSIKIHEQTTAQEQSKKDEINNKEKEPEVDDNKNIKDTEIKQESESHVKKKDNELDTLSETDSNNTFHRLREDDRPKLFEIN